MAKNDNLSDLLKSVADGIRTKEGTTDLINPQDFQTRIENLPSGGGVDLKRIGYTDEDNKEYNDYIENGLKYAEQIAANWIGIEDISNKFSRDDNLIFFPQVNFSKMNRYNSFLSRCNNLIGFPNFENNNVIKYGGYAFYDNLTLKKIGNIYKVSTLNSVGSRCPSLINVGIIDIENCTNFNNAFGGDGNLHTISFQKYKKIDFSLSTLKSLSIASINYLIEHAIGADGSAEQRTLTLHADAKKRWQDPNQNPQYEYYAAMAAEKLITIA